MTDRPGFDYYHPDPPIYCPITAVRLGDWRGTGGPCAGLRWRENVAAPEVEHLGEAGLAHAGQRLAGEVVIEAISPAFESGRLRVRVRCIVEGDCWTGSEIIEVLDLSSGKLYYSTAE